MILNINIKFGKALHSRRRKKSVESVNSGNAVLFPGVAMSGDDVEFAVIDHSPDMVVMLILNIKVV